MKLPLKLLCHPALSGKSNCWNTLGVIEACISLNSVLSSYIYARNNSNRKVSIYRKLLVCKQPALRTPQTFNLSCTLLQHPNLSRLTFCCTSYSQYCRCGGAGKTNKTKKEKKTCQTPEKLMPPRCKLCSVLHKACGSWNMGWRSPTVLWMIFIISEGKPAEGVTVWKLELCKPFIVNTGDIHLASFQSLHLLQAS